MGEKGIMIPLMVSETAIFIDSMLKRDHDAFNDIKNGYYLPDGMIDCLGPTNQGPSAYTMIDAGLFDKAIPDKSRSSKQKYRLPEKGRIYRRSRSGNRKHADCTDKRACPPQEGLSASGGLVRQQSYKLDDVSGTREAAVSFCRFSLVNS